EGNLRDRADVVARHTDGRSRSQAGHIPEECLEMIALPEEAAVAGQHEDRHAGDDDSNDGDEPDSELRPGERTCSWHLGSSSVKTGTRADTGLGFASAFRRRLRTRA